MWYCEKKKRNVGRKKYHHKCKANGHRERCPQLRRRDNGKKFRKIQKLLSEIRQDLKKEGGVRAEIALQRLTYVEERLDNLWKIITRKF